MTAAVGTLRQDVRVISLIAVAHGLSHFYQLVVAVLFPLIKVDLGVSYAALGAATAVFYTVSGVCQTLAGFAVKATTPLKLGRNSTDACAGYSTPLTSMRSVAVVGALGAVRICV